MASACSLTLACQPTGARAQSSEDLRIRIELLENELIAIREQLADRVEEDGHETANAAADTTEVVSRPGANRLKIDETTVDIYGLIDLDVHLTKFSDGELPSASIGRDIYLPILTPVMPDSPGKGDVHTDFTVQTSRFGIATQTPLNDKKLSTRIEVDFLLSPGGNEGISNSFNPRLRRAYIDYGGWRAGQDWTTFQAMQAMPESASFFAPAESQVFVRQPIIRRTIGNLQLALENPNTSVASIGLVDDGTLPDFIARYNFTGETYAIALSGIARQLRYRAGGINGKALGWGLSLAGRVYLGADDIRFSLQGGEGLGRYVGLGIAPGAIIDASGTDIEAVPTISGNAAYRLVFGRNSLSTGVSYMAIDYNGDLASPSSTARSKSAFAALTRHVTPSLSVAVEYLYGEREIEAGDKGVLSRFTLSVRQNF